MYLTDDQADQRLALLGEELGLFEDGRSNNGG
jgi:hypothetical protein